MGISSKVINTSQNPQTQWIVHTTSIFKDPEVSKDLAYLHEKYVVVPADKAQNNIVFVCKKHYIDCLIQELGIDNSLGNPTYTPTTLTKKEILDNHMSVLCSFGISTKVDELDLPSLYWIPKLHKNPYKQRYIAGSSRCSTKPLSILLTEILTTIKGFGTRNYTLDYYLTIELNRVVYLR